MRRLRLTVIFVQFFAILGCGESSKYAPVSGKVTVKGVPLADAVVQFIPESGTKGSGGIGHTDHDGSYSLLGPRQVAGVLPGEYKIRISRIVGPDGKVLARGETEADNPGYRDTVPPPYGGPRPTKSVDVPSDGATINIDIRTKLLDPASHAK